VDRLSSFPQLKLPGLSGILAEFGAPVAVVELPWVGAVHRFGTEGIDGELWSVDVESLYGLEVQALARTVRPIGSPLADTDPESLCASTIRSFLAARDPDAGAEPFTPLDPVTAAPRSQVELRVAGVPRRVLAIDCGDVTGVATQLAGNIVVAVLPSAALTEVNLGAVGTPDATSG
jgi:hypothetical protein